MQHVVASPSGAPRPILSPNSGRKRGHGRNASGTHVVPGEKAYHLVDFVLLYVRTDNGAGLHTSAADVQAPGASPNSDEVDAAGGSGSPCPPRTKRVSTSAEIVQETHCEPDVADLVRDDDAGSEGDVADVNDAAAIAVEAAAAAGTQPPAVIIAGQFPPMINVAPLIDEINQVAMAEDFTVDPGELQRGPGDVKVDQLLSPASTATGGDDTLTSPVSMPCLSPAPADTYKPCSIGFEFNGCSVSEKGPE